MPASITHAAIAARASCLPIGDPPAAFRASLDSRSLFPIPVVEPVTLWYLSRDVDDPRLGLPPLDQLLPPKHAQEELFDELRAPVLEQLDSRFHPAIERHRNLPRPRKRFRVVDRGFVSDHVWRHQRKALLDVQCLTVEIP